MAEGAVAAVAVLTVVVRQQAAPGRGRRRRVGRNGHDRLALANRRRGGQVTSPAGLGVTGGAAAAAAAAAANRRVAVDDEAFGGEVSLNLGSAAAAALHPTLLRFGRVSPRVCGSKTGAAVRRIVLLRFVVLSEDEASEARHTGEV